MAELSTADLSGLEVAGVDQAGFFPGSTDIVPFTPAVEDPFTFGSERGPLFKDGVGNIVDGVGNLIVPADQAMTILGDTGATPGPGTVNQDVLTQSIAQALGLQVDASGNIIPTSPGTAGTEPGTPPSTTDRINSFLKQPLGALLATLGLGGAGLGIQAALAPGASRIQIPQPPQTPGQTAVSNLFASNPAAAQALQQSILAALSGNATAANVLGGQLGISSVAQAAESPIQAAIRRNALGNVLANQEGGPPSDPVTRALRDQILSITATGTTNPLLERAFREQRDVLQNQMFTAEGPQWGITTPGIDASTKLAESQAIQNYEDYLNTIAALTGPYQSGVNQGINASTGLSQLGLPNVGGIVSSLGTIANPSAVGGVTATNEQALTGQSAQDLAAIESAIASANAQAGLGRSISGLLGTAVGNAFNLKA